MNKDIKQFEPKTLQVTAPQIVQWIPDDYKLFHGIVPQRLKQECEPFADNNDNHSQMQTRLVPKCK